MKLHFSCLLGLTFLCSPALAQSETPFDPARVDEFIELIAKNECRITNEAGEIYLPAAGFADRKEVRQIMSRLFYFGRARLVETETEGALVIYDGPCPEGGPETDPKTLFLGVVASNGCSLNAIENRALLDEAGVHMQEIEAMLPLLQNDGTLTLSADGETVTITDEDCNNYGPSPEMVADLVNDPIADPRGALIEYLEIVGCRIPYEEAKIDLPAAGFDSASLDKLVQDYLQEGIVAVGAGEILILTTGRCE